MSRSPRIITVEIHRGLIEDVACSGSIGVPCLNEKGPASLHRPLPCSMHRNTPYPRPRLEFRNRLSIGIVDGDRSGRISDVHPAV